MNNILCLSLILLFWVIASQASGLTAIINMNDGSLLSGRVLNVGENMIMIDPVGPVTLRNVTNSDAQSFKIQELDRTFTFPIPKDVLKSNLLGKAKKKLNSGSNKWKNPGLYVSGGLGLGVDFPNSKDINELFAPAKLTSFNLDLSANMRIGYRNNAQLEYRASVRDGSIIYDDEIDISMSLSSGQVFFKINPFSFSKENENNYGFFLEYGIGNSHGFLDEYNDGFRDGNINTYGLEFILFDQGTYLLCASMGIEYERIKYKYLDLGDSSYTLDTSLNCLKFLVHVNFGFNLGVK
jgi:hypothetical protein